MSTWLNVWRNRDARGRRAPIIELVVVAGADAGSQFTLEGAEVLVGRGQPRSGETHVVRLEDKSISRHQAWIRCGGAEVWIEHIDSASNPTRVNGREIDRVRLSAGDRIEMGRVAIDVRERKGTNLSGLTEMMGGVARDDTQTGPVASPPIASSASREAVSGESASGEVTEIREMAVLIGELRVVQGGTQVGIREGQVFPIGIGPTRIGRGDDVEVRIAEPGVSRLHAEMGVEGTRVVLRHKSQTNPTLLNGFPVLSPVELSDGDEIQLADRVVLCVRLLLADDSARGVTRAALSGDLSSRMETKITLDRSIEEFNVMGTFLDVDVVASRAMKVGSTRPEHIIVSFDRFRSFVSGICLEHAGQVLNSNGDELMCFFESASSAVNAGCAILDRLPTFNRESNLLSPPFRFRLGAHTGVSLVDLDAGVAYSDVLDTAGHIQKMAEPNTLLISQATLDSLEAPLPVTAMTDLTHEGAESSTLYRVEREEGPERVDSTRQSESGESVEVDAEVKVDAKVDAKGDPEIDREAT